MQLSAVVVCSAVCAVLCCLLLVVTRTCPGLDLLFRLFQLRRVCHCCFALPRFFRDFHLRLRLSPLSSSAHETFSPAFVCRLPIVRPDFRVARRALATVPPRVRVPCSAARRLLVGSASAPHRRSSSVTRGTDRPNTVAAATLVQTRKSANPSKQNSKCLQVFQLLDKIRVNQ